MRPDVFVLVTPVLDELSDIGNISKPMLVQAGIPKPGVEAVHECDLGRFTGPNEMQLYAGVLAPDDQLCWLVPGRYRRLGSGQR